MLSATRLCTFLLLASGTFAEIKNRGWWNNTIFYQIYPRSLLDSNGDGIGDLKGITSKLEYFVETGIDAIWLSPIYPSPQVDFGYDISDFTDVDPVYGNLVDLKVLLQKAKRLGLKVVLDLVPNHTSDKHIWFQKALKNDPKYKNYYVWANSKPSTNSTQLTPPNNWISVFSGSAWEYVPALGQWYLHQFEYRQPDLNFNNPEVQEEWINILKFWLDFGIDGFRVDSTAFIFEDSQLRDEPRSNIPGTTPRDYTYLNHIYTTDQIKTYELFGSWRKFIDEYSDQNNQDEKLLVMEAYTNFPNTILYYAYNVLPFNFEFIVNVTSQSTAQNFKEEIDLWINNVPNGGTYNWVLGNHDNPRVASRFPGRSDQMTMLSMVLPGLTVTYNGDEIGMVDERNITWEDTQDPQACNAGEEQYQRVSRDPERTPFQWDDTMNAGFSSANKTWIPVNKNYKELNLEKQKRDKKSFYKLYKSLVLLHKYEPALTHGDFTSFVANDNNVLGIIRFDSRSKRVVLLLMNFSKQSQAVKLSHHKVPFFLKVVASSLKSNVKEGSLAFKPKVRLPAESTVVYSGKLLF